MTGQPSTTIDGIVFDALDEKSAVSMITSRAVAGRGGFVITPNASILRQLRDPQHTELVASADLVLADGMPIVWASRLTPNRLPERVCGSELIWSVSAGAAQEGLPVLLLGGEDGIAERGAAALAERFPGLETHWHFPPFGFDTDADQMGDVLAAVHDSGARIVFVGLGFPKQERLIMRLRRQFPDVWFLACGAALTFVAGDISRAPTWMQEHGVEWVHRLVKEPRRLARRYLFGDIPFITALLVRLIWLRLAVAVSRPAVLPEAGGAALTADRAGARNALRAVGAPGSNRSTGAVERPSGPSPAAAGVAARRPAPARRRPAEAERAAS